MARTVANDPLQKGKFLISIPGLPAGMSFQKCSGLKRELAQVEYTESGYSHVHKLSGRETVDDVTLERGYYASADLEKLYKQSLNKSDFRTTVTISLCDKFGKVSKTWRLAEAWFKVWEGTDFDSESDDVAIEKITIAFEHFLD